MTSQVTGQRNSYKITFSKTSLWHGKSIKGDYFSLKDS